MSSTHTHSLTLAQVLEHMSPVQLAFFDKLNAELSKIESFFIDREGEGRTRSLQLRQQLEELKDHRRLFHVTEPFLSLLYATDWAISLTKHAHPENQPPMSFNLLSFPGSDAPKRLSRVLGFSHQPTDTDNKAPVEGHGADVARDSGAHHLAGGAKLDPDEYLHARKQLKRAVSEHYHALEVLNNYRVWSALSCLLPTDDKGEDRF
jgi:hypothetical protein